MTEPIWNQDLENEFQEITARLKPGKTSMRLLDLKILRKAAQKYHGNIEKYLQRQYEIQQDELLRRQSEERMDEQFQEDRYYLIDNFNPDIGGKLNTVTEIEKALRNFPPRISMLRGHGDYYTRLKSVYHRDYKAREPKKKSRKDTERMKKPDIQEMTNPFRSLYKNNNVKRDDMIKDLQIKPRIKKYSKPYFSPFPYSYEIDHLQYTTEITPYLFIININTRYLIVKKVSGKSGEETIRAIKEVMARYRIDNIRGDADRGYIGGKTGLTSYLNQLGIKHYFPSSGYINKNRIVDSVMRTLRNALGPNSDKYWSGRFDDIIQDLVRLYNNSPHKALKFNGRFLTPFTVQNDITLEMEYIQRMNHKLNKVNQLLRNDGLLNLQPGNIVMIYLNKGKTSQSFDKKRRVFEYLGEFLEYDGGNVRVLINGIEKIIPIYWIEYVSQSWDTLPQKYYQTFNLTRPNI